jgi:hypothetical protein
MTGAPFKPGGINVSADSRLCRYFPARKRLQYDIKLTVTVRETGSVKSNRRYCLGAEFAGNAFTTRRQLYSCDSSRNRVPHWLS